MDLRARTTQLVLLLLTSLDHILNLLAQRLILAMTLLAMAVGSIYHIFHLVSQRLSWVLGV